MPCDCVPMGFGLFLLLFRYVVCAFKKSNSKIQACVVISLNPQLIYCSCVVLHALSCTVAATHSKPVIICLSPCSLSVSRLISLLLFTFKTNFEPSIRVTIGKIFARIKLEVGGH